MLGPSGCAASRTENTFLYRTSSRPFNQGRSVDPPHTTTLALERLHAFRAFQIGPTIHARVLILRLGWIWILSSRRRDDPNKHGGGGGGKPESSRHDMQRTLAVQVPILDRIKPKTLGSSDEIPALCGTGLRFEASVRGEGIDASRGNKHSPRALVPCSADGTRHASIKTTDKRQGRTRTAAR
jgi:hypothetical protein